MDSGGVTTNILEGQTCPCWYLCELLCSVEWSCCVLLSIIPMCPPRGYILYVYKTTAWCKLVIWLAQMVWAVCKQYCRPAPCKNITLSARCTGGGSGPVCSYLSLSLSACLYNRVLPMTTCPLLFKLHGPRAISFWAVSFKQKLIPLLFHHIENH